MLHSYHNIISVDYANGDNITTPYNHNVPDEEILAYYAVGRKFNLGSVEDDMQEVVKRRIIQRLPRVGQEFDITYRQFPDAPPVRMMLEKIDYNASPCECFTVVDMAKGTSFTTELRWFDTAETGRKLRLVG
jgi:hypothetical protein